MKDPDATKWWESLDGELPPQEQSELDHTLKSDAQQNAAFMERKHLDQMLRQPNWEQPSMRFSQNLMEALQKSPSWKAGQPLISKTWRWIFGMSAALSVLGILISPWLLEDAGGSGTSKTVSSLLEAFNQLPFQWMLMSAAVLSGILLLVFMDKLLGQRLESGKH